MSQVLFEKVTKRYADFTALETLDLEVREGEFLTLLGPSGCGKTTTLRLIAGFLEPTEGRILIDREDVTRLPPQKRNIGMVFQDYALFPHLTIGENIGFGLVERRVPKDRIKTRVKELLELIRLPDVANRYPSEVSGGQQQRIAVARAVAVTPRVLLMDEPLGALDLKLREAMQIELRRIQQELKITTVYVTHDQGEAISMSDRIAVMNLGRLEQLGSPTDIYNRPRTRFVADFIGKINFLNGTVSAVSGSTAMIDTPGGRVQAPLDGAAPRSGAVTLAVRPENLSLARPGTALDGFNAVKGRIEEQVFAGSLFNTRIRVDDATRILVETKADELVARVGDEILVAWKPEKGILLGA